MAFNSWKDFENFEASVRSKYRFIHSSEVNDFLENLKETLPVRARKIALDTICFRSQIGYDTYESEGQIGACGYPSERMKPTSKVRREGRANPKGISYLYLSNDGDTSLAELRPHKGELISLAEFRIARELNVVDCVSRSKRYDLFGCYFNPPVSQEEIGDAIWSKIGSSFSKPVSNNDSSSDYVPTQVLAELFKSENFDGICFKSGMREGLNYLLFDIESADFIKSTVMETKSISYEFSEFTDHYRLQEKQ